MAISQFEHGVLYAAAQIVRLHDEPQVAADLLKQAGLAGTDCSLLDDYDKESLRIINEVSGMALTGLDAAEHTVNPALQKAYELLRAGTTQSAKEVVLEALAADPGNRELKRGLETINSLLHADYVSAE